MSKPSENLDNSNNVVLQILSKKNIGLVKNLGKKSGLKIDKDKYLRKQNLLKWKDYEVLDNCCALIELKKNHPKLPVIILSIFPEDHYGTRFLKAGASGYLGKASASELLVEAIRKVAGGGKYISPELTDKLVTDLTKDSEKPAHEMLTDREFQVFRGLASGKKIKEIADELCLSINTISTYRSRILQKMDMASNAELIRYAIEMGLIS